MKINVLSFTALIILIIFFSRSLQSATIGSDTAVTRFNTSQVANNGDIIAGFAQLAQGFTMNGSIFWNCFFPIIGDVGLNRGTLVLNEDFIFHNVAQLLTLGNIGGQSHVFEFSPSINCIPSLATCALCFVNQTTGLPAQINSVSWSFDSRYVAIGVNSTAGNELIIYEWNDITLTLRAGVSLGNNALSVDWHPTRDWIAVGRTSGGGDDLYNYSFNRLANTLTLLSSVNTGGGGNSVNEVVWHPDGDHLGIARDGTNELSVYPVNTVTGVFGAPVTVGLTPNANSVSWNSTGGFIVVGTVVAAAFNELRVYTFVKSPISLTLNASLDTGATINSVDWNTGAGNTNFIAAGLSTGTNTLNIYTHNSGAGTLTLTTGALTTQVNSVVWNPLGTCIAAAINANARGEVETFSFNGSSLTLADSREFGENVFAVDWSPNGNLLISGDGTGIGTPTLTVYLTGSAQPASITFANVAMYLNNDVTFKDANLTFTGISMIDGKGNTMTLASTFTMFIGSGASVLFKDIFINGLNDNRIRGVDSTSTFSFQNVELGLDADFTFTNGRIDVLDNCKIVGNGLSFIYQSTQPFTIRGGTFLSTNTCSPINFGSLILDSGVTFSYDSSSSTNLVLENAASRIVLNSATLAARTTLQLTKGMLMVDGKSSIFGATSIIFGDGISAANNLSIELMPAANLNIIRGSLIYRNL